MTGDCCALNSSGIVFDGKHLMCFQNLLENRVSTGQKISLQDNNVLPLGVLGVS